jgi:hypothetical protein
MVKTLLPRFFVDLQDLLRVHYELRAERQYAVVQGIIGYRLQAGKDNPSFEEVSEIRLWVSAGLAWNGIRHVLVEATPSQVLPASDLFFLY